MWRKSEENKSASAAQDVNVPATPVSASGISTSEIDPRATVAAMPPANDLAATNSTASVSPQSPNPSVQPPSIQAGRISSALAIKGEITGSDDLFVDGDVRGKITIAEGRVTIGANGRVTADIVAREIVIQGNVQGNLDGRERVQIGSTGCARGNVVTRRFIVEDGAEIHGNVEIGPAAEPRAEGAESGLAPDGFAAPVSEEVEVAAAHTGESRTIV